MLRGVNMGFLSDLFNKGFKRKTSIDEAVEEVFSEVFTIDKNVNITKYFPDYPRKYGFLCNYVISDHINQIRWIIIVLCHNGEKSKDYKQLLEEMRKRKIKVIHFFEQLPNEKEYVIRRIRNLM
jgi:hypothetical protein